MSRAVIDRDKLSVALRGLDDRHASALLEAAMDLVPDAKLAQLVERYVALSAVRPDSKRVGVFLADVKAFEKASLAGDYYESFSVNSKNFMDESKGTRRWIAECERLFERCVRHGAKQPAETLEAFEILFGLLRHIDAGHDDVVFFADEGGSWRVGGDRRETLRAFFSCLSKGTGPEAFARRVNETIEKFGRADRKEHLAAARAVATPVQRRALQATRTATDHGRRTQRR